MKRELGIARCGLACCLCSENDTCGGCDSSQCHDREWCMNRKCSMEKGLEGCWQCAEPCREGMQGKIKPYGFTEFIRRHGKARLLDILEANEKHGVVYHRQGIQGDYDAFEEAEALISFLLEEP